jgi:CDP-diacylglycerol---serine O-phosphatidyltransferase
MKKKAKKIIKKIEQSGEKVKAFLIELRRADYFLLAALAGGVISAFFSNQEKLSLALAFLLLAMMVSFMAEKEAHRREEVHRFTAMLEGLVKAMIFLVAPGIFLYHWQFRGPFEEAMIILFILSGILRISATQHLNNAGHFEIKGRDRGMPVYAPSFLIIFFYLISPYISLRILNPVFAVSLGVFSVLMLTNLKMPFLHAIRRTSWVYAILAVFFVVFVFVQFKP